MNLTLALIGNPNCGKTTLFNQLTGSNQHVGNVPGVTVDKTEGSVRAHPGVTVVDLPGIYSLSPYRGHNAAVSHGQLIQCHKKPLFPSCPEMEAIRKSGRQSS